MMMVLKVYKRPAADSAANVRLCRCRCSGVKAESQQGKHQVGSEVLAGEHCQPPCSAVGCWWIELAHLKRCENLLMFMLSLLWCSNAVYDWQPTTTDPVCCLQPKQKVVEQELVVKADKNEKWKSQCFWYSPFGTGSVWLYPLPSCCQSRHVIGGWWFLFEVVVNWCYIGEHQRPSNNDWRCYYKFIVIMWQYNVQTCCKTLHESAI